MSAREELLRNLRGYEPREEIADDPAAQLLDAYRAEVLREAAQRAEGHANGAHGCCGPCSIAEAIADDLRWMAQDTP